MSDQILQGFLLFASWETLVIIPLGVLVGMVIGAIPGLTVTMAIALALPFTFTMEPVAAILLLISIYKGGMLGGSVSAILINAPGTAAAAATALDGYPLAQRGESGRALKAAVYASCIGDIASCFAVIVFAGALASLALYFGPPEFVWLIAFSMTIIATISGGSVVKAIISGCLGVLLSTIGLDLVYGTERLIFGNYNLMEGVSFIPVLIGLFAIPEVLKYYIHGAAATTVISSDASRLPWSDLKRCMKTILRGTAIGIGVGIIPGAGPTTSSFISYGEAQRASPQRDNFGKGEVEGICAAESANSSTTAASLIPLLALGIPGDVVAAIIVGAFMLHGLSPGPLMFKENIDVIYALYMGLIASSITLFLVSSPLTKWLAKIAYIPKSSLYPVVLMFCAFGSYSIRASMFDVLLMLIFGFAGFFMRVTGVGVVPFVLGFVLGPLFEDNLRRSFLISTDLTVFVRGPITWIFIALFLFSVFVAVRRQIGGRRAAKKRELLNEA